MYIMALLCIKEGTVEGNVLKVTRGLLMIKVKVGSLDIYVSYS